MPALIMALGTGCLSADERLQAVQEIWGNLANEAAPLIDARRQEVDHHWAAHLANPQAAIPWEQVEGDMLDRLRR